MKRFIPLLLLFICFGGYALAQPADSVQVSRQDSLARKDSVITPDTAVVRKPVSVVHRDNWPLPFSFNNVNRLAEAGHPYFGFSATTSSFHTEVREFHGKEMIFYALMLLLVIYALFRRAFPKYFNDLFRLFFRTTLKQRQIREQLMQTPFPSLLLNIFFVVSGGLYCAFVMKRYQLGPLDNFWVLFFYCALGLSAVYFVKFIGLKVTGWLFDMPEVSNDYIFIVFVINKVLGILLLPFLVLLAFGQNGIYMAALTLSWCSVAALLLYRFVLTYAIVRNQVKVNPFHFFLYLCAFEIAPLLLIYKGLLLFFHITS